MMPFATQSSSRRHFLKSTCSGFGYLAFAYLAQQTRGGEVAKSTHFPAKAKHVIFLCMQGGPSHVDLFDYKPGLEQMRGEDVPTSIYPPDRKTGTIRNGGYRQSQVIFDTPRPFIGRRIGNYGRDAPGLRCSGRNPASAERA